MKINIPKTIQLSQGAGGRMMEILIEKVIAKPLKMTKFEDAGIIQKTKIVKNNLAITTDGCSVRPMFYPGGDIGSLSVYATINDLAMMGAKPLAMTFGLFMQEGLDIKILKRVVKEMGRACEIGNCPIITGDTKVLERNKMEGILINTAGVGVIQTLISDYGAKPGDKIIVSGTMGDHGLSLIAYRFNFKSSLKSDGAPLWDIVKEMLKIGGVHALKDPTRGGFTPNANELARKSNVCFYIYEDKIPFKKEALALAEVLGIDPLQTACEGKFIMACDSKKADKLLACIKKSKYGKEAAIIGEVRKFPKKRVILETSIGGKKILESPIGEQYPRIC
ncbi:MAG: hydrogenase expression/formation protein HypE [Candidatus Kuenenbacteria bacterium]